MPLMPNPMLGGVPMSLMQQMTAPQWQKTSGGGGIAPLPQMGGAAPQPQQDGMQSGMKTLSDAVLAGGKLKDWFGPKPSGVVPGGNPLDLQAINAKLGMPGTREGGGLLDGVSPSGGMDGLFNPAIAPELAPDGALASISELPLQQAAAGGADVIGGALTPDLLGGILGDGLVSGSADLLTGLGGEALGGLGAEAGLGALGPWGIGAMVAIPLLGELFDW